MEELVHRPQSSFQFEYPTPQKSEHRLVPAHAEIGKAARPKVKRGEIPSLLSNANILFKHDESELAFALLRQALKIDSHHPEVLKQLSHYHHSHKNWQMVARSLEVVLKQDYSFDNLAKLAEAYYLLGEDQKSLVRYEEALSILMDTPKNLFDVYKNVGNIYCRIGDFQAAEEAYFKAFTLNPRSDTLLINLGTLEVQKFDYEKALEKFRAALEINPDNDKGWVGLAIVHEKMGDFDLARANIENAVDLAPGNRTAVHILSAWAARDQKFEPAISALEDYLSQVEQDEEMSLALIHLFCMTEQFDLARLEVERVLLWNPKQEAVLELSSRIPG